MIIALKIVRTLLVVFPAIMLIIWVPRWCAEEVDELPEWYLTLTDVLYTAWCCEAIIVLLILVLIVFAVAILAIWEA